MKKTIKLNINALLSPLLYFTLALFAGEMSLDRLGFSVCLNSSVMYLLFGVALTFKLIKGKMVINKNNSIVFVFYLYLIFRNITSDAYIIENYWAPMLITLFILFFINNETEYVTNIRRFINYSFWISGSLLLLALLYNVITHSVGRLYFLGGPNGFYKLALVFGSIAFYKLLETKEYIYIVCLILAIVGVFLTGSKGGIISLIAIALLAYLLYLFDKSEKRSAIIIKIIKSVIAVIIVYLTVSYILSRSPQLQQNVDRAISIFSGDRDKLSSVQARRFLIMESYYAFLESPIIGKGALFLHYETQGTIYFQSYAHNIFMEVLGEQGLIGLALLVAILFRTGYQFVFQKKDYVVYTLFLCFMTYMIGAQFSGNMLDSKMIFVFSILMSNYAIQKKAKSVERFEGER